MNDLFGGVVYAGIDTDRYKYPIGKCGRVNLALVGGWCWCWWEGEPGLVRG
jgi:hypothetical protein